MSKDMNQEQRGYQPQRIEHGYKPMSTKPNSQPPPPPPPPKTDSNAKPKSK